MPNLKFFNVSSVRQFLMVSIAVISIQVSAQQFSKADVLSDLDYLRTSMEDAHINLYAYISKDAFEEHYLELKKQITKDSLSLFEVIYLFQKVVAKTNNAHTRIDEPDQARPYINYFNSGGTLFPLEVAIEDGKAFVRKNWSTNTNIQIGAELKTINGIPIQQVFNKIYPLISAERLYFKNALLEGFSLPRYYWMTFGEVKVFEVNVIQEGIETTQKLSAIKALDDYEMKRKGILEFDWKLDYLSDSVAYLRPGMFGGNLDNYKRFVDSAFTDINSKKSQNLIIDLRNHPGGDDPFGDYLVSYLIDKPFKWSSIFQLKSSAILKDHVLQNQDTTTAYAKSILAHKNGEVYEYDFGFHEPQHVSKRFHGSVYVLVNRHSYSQSTVTAAQIQDYGIGQIVGEETGEFPNLYASIFTYQLPKTGIKLDISKGKMERLSGIDNGKGVIPDLIIKDHLLDETDEIVDGLLKALNTE